MFIVMFDETVNKGYGPKDQKPWSLQDLRPNQEVPPVIFVHKSTTKRSETDDR